MALPPSPQQIGSHQARATEWMAMLEAGARLYDVARSRRDLPWEPDHAVPAHSIYNLRRCGRSAWVEYSATVGEHRIACERCGLRVCPTCASKLGAVMERRVREWIGVPKQHRWRMITLSMRSNDTTLVSQIAALRAAFRRLRQARCWADTQTYGLAQLEATFNTTTNQWHPHLHTLMHGYFIDIYELVRAWHNAVGEQAVVHIREVDSAAQAGRYVAKYLGKPVKLTRIDQRGEVVDLHGVGVSSLPLDKAEELFLAICGKKWTWRVGQGPPLPKDPGPSDNEVVAEDWVRVGSLADLLRDAKGGNARAQEICARLGINLTPRPPP